MAALKNPIETRERPLLAPSSHGKTVDELVNEFVQEIADMNEPDRFITAVEAVRSKSRDFLKREIMLSNTRASSLTSVLSQI